VQAGQWLLTALGAYLMGSIPTGFLFAKAKGIDIRSVGSGNIGATNAFRVLGKGPGSAVLLIDAFKGWAAVKLFLPFLLRFFSPGEVELTWLPIVAGVCAVLGHNYTCWLKFKGGKGIATSAGVLLAWQPLALLIIFLIWIVVFVLSKYVSLASIAAAAGLPVAAYFTRAERHYLIICTFLAALAIIKHWANIQRLLNGTENRVGKKPTQNEGKAQ
jgi:glycerol-3-phosphate acyltransferase PlsY